MDISIGGKGNGFFEGSNILILGAECAAEREQICRILRDLKYENIKVAESWDRKSPPGTFEIYIEIKT